MEIPSCVDSALVFPVVTALVTAIVALWRDRNKSVQLERDKHDATRKEAAEFVLQRVNELTEQLALAQKAARDATDV